MLNSSRGLDVVERDAVKAQVTYTWQRMVPFMDLKDACFKDILPTPFVSTITDDCIARGKAGASISNSLSPSNGAERNGLTAAFRSMAKLDQRRMRNCVAYNPSIHPSYLDGHAIGRFADLLATYFDMGGLQVQPNVVSTETLKDAQQHPENYRHLTVKVSGFSALFVELHRRIQNDIIARTALRA